MRVLMAVACGMALASLVVAAFAMRSADRSRAKAERVAMMLSTYRGQVAEDRRTIRALKQHEREAAVTTKAVGAICYAARHAQIPQGSDYALQIGRSIIDGMARSCDYARVPDVAAAP